MLTMTTTDVSLHWLWWLLLLAAVPLCPNLDYLRGEQGQVLTCISVHGNNRGLLP